MEERKEGGGACGGSGCQHGCSGAHGGMWDGEGMHKFFLLRMLLLLAIVSFVFWGGMKLGELKSSLYGDGYRHKIYNSYGCYPRQRTLYYDDSVIPDNTYDVPEAL
ncbi:MAG: hypothetical protein U1A26_01990 [Candidatus Sungbacteria bacterium]|nr:hypothetical protein [Candidatus Sungbacteria bacterium]